MTKLEQKLQELGYLLEYRRTYWSKLVEIGVFQYGTSIIIGVNDNKTKITYYGVYPNQYELINERGQLEVLLKAFDEMQKDLEELKKCQD